MTWDFRDQLHLHCNGSNMILTPRLLDNPDSIHSCYKLNHLRPTCSMRHTVLKDSVVAIIFLYIEQQALI